MNQKILFNNLLLRYNKYHRKLQRLMVTGRNEHRQSVLKKHIERLRVQLGGLYDSIRLAGAATILSGAMLLSTPDASAQATFQTGQKNQYGLGDVGDVTRPVLVDLDGDGLKDVVTGRSAGDFAYYKNTGTAARPVFTGLVFWILSGRS